ncbi:MAG: amidase [Ferrovibrio sp.]|uniref:amidase n=1 Tax=Ferrovibrio sp. TaxID=1917215 RepID=UPI00260734D9|nr:amidase [Ferrovibrio sp.]MCW0234915.1 amidase [Ferrovibrio sp.]
MNAPAAARSSRDRLEVCLARIEDPDGEGQRAFTRVYAERARAAAEASDARTRLGQSLGPLDGRIVSVKDLFDIPGEPTTAGSKLRRDATPAIIEALAIARLRAAGAVIIGKTNMTEFAFSGVGINPHYGTPGNPADRSRIPGGSSSGGAVSVADGMAEITIGSDTGGSTRIPAALCGIVGLKPSQYRVPTAGAFPLSYALDSIGPMAGSVADCALADAVMAGEAPVPLALAAPLAGLRLGIPQGPLMEGMEPAVAATFDSALALLGKAGARISDHPLPLLADMLAVNTKGGFAATEAYFIHRAALEQRPGDFDPLVRGRIERGRAVPAADYIFMQRRRAELITVMDRNLADLDALILPTTPIVAPKIIDLIQDEAPFTTANMLLLRNTAVANFFDLCAISLPLPVNGLPIGLMLVARNGQDRRLLRLAQAVDNLLR